MTLLFWFLIHLKYYFLKIKEITDKFGIEIIFMQYPLRSVVPLKNIFENIKVGIVDNEQNFKSAITVNSFSYYFVDIFAGDFGHCSREGNKLIAENLKNTILKDIFQWKNQKLFFCLKNI